MATKEYIDEVIGELQNWHNVRTRLNDKPGRKKDLNLDTLPRAIKLLEEYRNSKQEFNQN